MWRCSILALLLIAAACGRADRSRHPDHSLAQADSAAADSTADADRPCLAARVGLPCK